MKIKHILAALLAVAPVSAFASEPVAESLSYRAYIGGLPLGTLALNIAMDDTRYATDAQFDVASVWSWALDTDARASARGGVANGQGIPTNFDYWVRDGKKQRVTEMLFDAEGKPTEVRANPVFDKRSYDIELGEVGQAIDPATAAAMLSAPRSQPCDVDLRVFDGRKLHRITMKRVSGSVEEPRCAGTYERLAGFKDKYMTPERRSYDFDAELVQIAPNRWRPRRVSAETKYGSAIIVLQ